MTTLLGLLCLLSAPEPVFERLDLDELGFYHAFSLDTYKVEEHFLIVGAMENLLVLIDAQGNELARYDEAGPGPLELEFPDFIGVANNEILITNKRRVMRFDLQLKPNQTNLPSLPIRNFQGFPYNGQSFFIAPPSRSGVLAMELEATEKGWRILDEFFPFTYKPGRLGYPCANFHGLKVYHCKSPRVKEPYYEIDYYSFLKNKKPDLTLYASIEGMSSHDVVVYASTTFPYGDYHVVEVQQADRETLALLANFYDLFDKDGKHIKRIPREGEPRPIVVEDTNLVYELDIETMMLVRLELDLTGD